MAKASFHTHTAVARVVGVASRMIAAILGQKLLWLM